MDLLPPEAEIRGTESEVLRRVGTKRGKVRKPKEGRRKRFKLAEEKGERENTEEAISQLTRWINDRLSLGSVPRSRDVLEYAIKNKLSLSRGQVSRVVRLHPAYHMNVHQQREPHSSRKDMIVLTNTPGTLHCDIGFFPVVRDYETPKTFRYGFLIAKDVLTRRTYLELMGNRKTTETLMKVISRIIERHGKFNLGYPIIKIQFDKESGMKGQVMEKFLAGHHTKRHLFQHSRSKAKFAESGIRLVREKVARLMRDDPSRRWWQLLPAIEKELNSEEIVVQGKGTGYSPGDINSGNVKDFIRQVQKKVPSYYFAQFQIPPQVVKFKFKVGDIVRPKILLASSQVLGVKRSQENLEHHRFRIESLRPFTTKDLQVRPGYKCVNVQFGGREVFAEQDIALSY